MKGCMCEFDMFLHDKRVHIIVDHYLPESPPSNDGGCPEEFEYRVFGIEKISRDDEEMIFRRYIQEVESIFS